MAKWRRGEHDDLAWLDWWLDMLRGHAAAGRTCRRAHVVSERLSDYQRWTLSHAAAFVEAGVEIRYESRRRLATVESAYLEWSRQSRAGMRRLGDLHSPATYRRTTTFRIHEPTVMPGIFQTEANIRRMLSFWYAFLDAPDDADATVAMKADRTAIALHPSKRIAAVLGEQALRTRRGTPQEHSDQLNHLISLMRLPFVSVGIIPANAQRHAIASIGFWIFDNNAVALETPTAAIKVTRPNEIALYATLFDQLHAEAVYGARARQLITEVLSDL